MEKIKDENPNTEQYWDKRYSEGEKSRQNLWMQERFKYIFEGKTRAIEYGCGTGETIFKCKLNNSHMDFTGIDFSSEAIQKACTNHPYSGRFYHVDAQEYYENGGYDVAFCVQTLEHVDDPGKVCQNMLKCVKGGGYVVITVPMPHVVDECGEHVNKITGDDFRKWLGSDVDIQNDLDNTKFVAVKRKDSELESSKVKTAFIVPCDDKPVRPVGIWKKPIHSWSEWTRIVPIDGFYGSVLNDDNLHILDKYDVIIIVTNVYHYSLFSQLYILYNGKKRLGTFADSVLMSLFKTGTGEWPIHNFMKLVNKYTFHLSNRPRGDMFWKVYFPDTPTFFLSFPIDLDYYKNRYGDQEMIKDKVFVIGDHYCTSAIGLLYRDHQNANIHIIRYRLASSEKQIKQFPLNITFHDKGDQEHFCNIANGSEYAIYLDSQGSVGRAPRDMAALGIPCIGMSHTGYQNSLFPDLTMTSFNMLDSVGRNIKNLKGDTKYRDYIISHSKKELAEYDINRSIKRYYEIIDIIMRLKI